MPAIRDVLLCQEEDKLLPSSEKAKEIFAFGIQQASGQAATACVGEEGQMGAILSTITIPRLATRSTQTATQCTPGGCHLGNETAIYFHLIPTSRMCRALLLQNLNDNSIALTYTDNF